MNRAENEAITDLSGITTGRESLHVPNADSNPSAYFCAKPAKQQGAKDPRHLWPHVARIIREVEPALELRLHRAFGAQAGNSR
jgi:hypothetical protein